MTEKRFLITGANGDIGYNIARILREKYSGSQIFGADAVGIWPAKAICDEVYTLPWASNAGYVNALIDLAKKLNPTAILVYNEAELRCIAEQHAAVTGLPLLGFSPALIRLFTDKLDTAVWLSEHGFPMPKTTLLSAARSEDLPIIIKPRRGSGSRGIEIVNSLARLQVAQMERAADTVAQAYIGSAENEYTCAVIRLGGAVRTLVMQRWLTGGMSGRITIKALPEIEILLRRIAEKVELNGVLNVQLRLAEDGAQIFEINPRFSSTVMMRHRLGFEDLCWLIEYQAGCNLPEFSAVAEMRVFRVSDEVVVSPC